jgi:Ca2+-binding RTX toxin-like protein
MATTTKITLDGANLLGADPSQLLNISRPLSYYSNFDGGTLFTTINGFAGEPITPAVVADKANDIKASPAVPGTWIPKVTGADAYDLNLTTLQTINLYTKTGTDAAKAGTLLIKVQNTDANNATSSYDFNSADGAVSLATNSTISNAAPPVNPKAKPAKVNPNIKLAYDDRSNTIVYTNKGVTGTQDDIRADLTQISKAVLTTKNNVFSAKINYQESLNYYEGDKFKFEVSTKKAVLSDSLALSFSPTKNSIVINKYNYLSNDFSISLTGSITGSWGVDGNTEIMNLPSVQVETTNYSLRSTNLTSKNVYTNAEYVEKSGLTNLETYNLTAVSDMQNSFSTRDLPKILLGNNVINLKGAGSVDAGAGNDIIVGTSGDNTLIGNIGSDKLTGGKGADTFSFQTSDFLSLNSNGDLVFNKSVDMITDFNKKDSDSIIFDDKPLDAFPHNLAEAKMEKMPLFYMKGSVYFDNPNDAIYAPTVIIKLTGNPKVNATFDDFLA